MILYSEEEGLIKAKGIKKLDGTRDANYKLPHIAVGVFSEYLLEDIVEKFECVKVGVISGDKCRHRRIEYERGRHVYNFRKLWSTR